MMALVVGRGTREGTPPDHGEVGSLPHCELTSWIPDRKGRQMENLIQGLSDAQVEEIREETEDILEDVGFPSGEDVPIGVVLVGVAPPVPPSVPTVTADAPQRLTPGTDACVSEVAAGDI